MFNGLITTDLKKIITIVFVTVVAIGSVYLNLLSSGPHYPFRFSPNFDNRPDGAQIDTVVLHATQIESLRKVIKYFSMPDSKLSSHFTIDRDGKIFQHVADNKRAWHAGESRMADGRERVNDFSIGIELVNLNDGKDPYPNRQINALILLIQQLKIKYPIKYVVTHAEIAMPPGRKSDPIGLDLNSIFK